MGDPSLDAQKHQQEPKGIAVVDGANISHLETANGGPRVRNIVAVCRTLERNGYDPVVIIDPGLRHEIDLPDLLERMIDEHKVRQAPANTDADSFILEIAHGHDVVVVSNDRFDGFRDQHAWIAERRIPVMIIKGEVELYEPKL